MNLLAEARRRWRIRRAYRQLYRLMERERRNAEDWMRWLGPR